MNICWFCKKKKKPNTTISFLHFMAYTIHSQIIGLKGKPGTIS